MTDSDDEEVVHKSASGKVYNKDGFEIVPQQKVKKRKALGPEELALGEQLIKSKKAKRDIMDNGWHRFMFDDENLPDWFVKEEEMHMKKNLDVDRGKKQARSINCTREQNKLVRERKRF